MITKTEYYEIMKIRSKYSLIISLLKEKRYSDLSDIKKRRIDNAIKTTDKYILRLIMPAVDKCERKTEMGKDF